MPEAKPRNGITLYRPIFRIRALTISHSASAPSPTTDYPFYCLSPLSTECYGCPRYRCCPRHRHAPLPMVT